MAAGLAPRGRAAIVACANPLERGRALAEAFEWHLTVAPRKDATTSEQLGYSNLMLTLGLQEVEAHVFDTDDEKRQAR